MRRTLLSLLVPALIALPATSCRVADADTDSEAVAKPQLVTVTAGDFFFRMPDTLQAGVTTLRIVNNGPGLHHIALLRLNEGHTMADLMEALGKHGPLPAWAEEVGGPNTPAPGDSAQTAVDLAAGRYAAICFIPTAEGVPHVMKGMAHEFTVVPTSAASEEVSPVSDATITLDDYSFTVEPRLVAGPQVLRVVNRASQSHEVLFVQLAPGRTAEDIVAWVEKPDGPPPGRPMGGTTGFRPGMVNYVHLDLAPGRYALLCFLPDVGDGRPHVAHGMTSHFTID